MTMTTERERESSGSNRRSYLLRPHFTQTFVSRLVRPDNPFRAPLTWQKSKASMVMRPAAARRRHTWRENQTSGHQPLQHAPVSGRSSIRGTNNEHAEARACGRDCRGAQGRDCPTVSKASEGRCRPSRCSALPTAQLASWMLSHLFYEILEV